MSMQAAFAKALYEELTGDGTLAAMVSVISQWPDQDETLPLMYIGDDQHAGWIRKGEDGDNVVTSIHIFSDYRGWKEADDIADRTRFVLNGQGLSMAGSYSTIGATGFFEDSVRFIEDDGKRRRMVLTFRYLIQGPAIPNT